MTSKIKMLGQNLGILALKGNLFGVGVGGGGGGWMGGWVGWVGGVVWEGEWDGGQSLSFGDLREPYNVKNRQVFYLGKKIDPPYDPPKILLLL